MPILAAALLLGDWRQRFEDARPVELDVRVVLFDQTNRILVDRRASDADAWRSAKEIQKTLAAPATAAAGTDQERSRFVAAVVASEPEVRQALSPDAGRGLLRLCLARRAGRTRLSRRSGARRAWAVRLGCDGARGVVAMDERESRLVRDRVIAPDLGDRDGVFHTEPPRDVDHRGRYVQMKGCSNAPEVRPLRHRFEMIDGFGRFDFDDAVQPAPLSGRREHEVRKHLTRANADARGLFFAGVGRHVVFPLELRLQQSDDPVVLELLADRPNQNRTQESSGEPVMVTHE